MKPYDCTLNTLQRALCVPYRSRIVYVYVI